MAPETQKGFTLLRRAASGNEKNSDWVEDITSSRQTFSNWLQEKQMKPFCALCAFFGYDPFVAVEFHISCAAIKAKIS